MIKQFIALVSAIITSLAIFGFQAAHQINWTFGRGDESSGLDIAFFAGSGLEALAAAAQAIGPLILGLIFLAYIRFIIERFPSQYDRVTVRADRLPSFSEFLTLSFGDPGRALSNSLIPVIQVVTVGALLLTGMIAGESYGKSAANAIAMGRVLGGLPGYTIRQSVILYPRTGSRLPDSIAKFNDGRLSLVSNDSDSITVIPIHQPRTGSAYRATTVEKSALASYAINRDAVPPPSTRESARTQSTPLVLNLGFLILLATAILFITYAGYRRDLKGAATLKDHEQIDVRSIPLTPMTAYRIYYSLAGGTDVLLCLKSEDRTQLAMLRSDSLANFGVEVFDARFELSDIAKLWVHLIHRNPSRNAAS